VTDPAARLQYLAETIARGTPSGHVCAAQCGKPVSRWTTDAAGQHWHPDCLPAGARAEVTDVTVPGDLL
jgi:hypothetical protein